MKNLKLLLAVLGVGCAALSSRAVTLTVTSPYDGWQPILLTLRQAIADSSSGDTINFAVTGTITLTSGELGIAQNLTIIGPGATNLTINGNHSSRIFNISGGPVNISGLTISNGYAAGVSGATATSGQGGGIITHGGSTLILSSCVLIQNAAVGGTSSSSDGGSGQGGAVFNSGTLILIGCTLTGNAANGGSTYNYPFSGYGEGGGVANIGLLLLTNCTISGNSASGGIGYSGGGGGIGDGGGIWSPEYKSISLNCCTISGNTSQGGAGYYAGEAYGGGISCYQDMAIRNTIIAGNSVTAGSGLSGQALGPDVLTSRTITSGGYNFIGKTNGSSGWVASDLTGSIASQLDPHLGPLQDNGGPTPTMAPLAGSAAIDNGNSFGVTTDQRGLPRPVVLPGYPVATGGDGSDIGACELQSVTLDIGLRTYDGTATNKIACEIGTLTSPLRISKNGTTYGILLVDPSAPNASKLHVQTASGVKAWEKLP